MCQENNRNNGFDWKLLNLFTSIYFFSFPVKQYKDKIYKAVCIYQSQDTLEYLIKFISYVSYYINMFFIVNSSKIYYSCEYIEGLNLLECCDMNV